MALTHLKEDPDPGLMFAEQSGQPAGSLNRALLERFRCAESVAAVHTVRASDGEKAQGFVNGFGNGLPADPEQAIDSLRLEHYASSSARPGGRLLTGPLVRGAYYGLRPFLTVGTRKYLQRIALRDWSNRTFPEWPVDRTVEHILEGLLLQSMKEKKLESVPFIWFWPEGRASCAIVTHDVETEAGRRFCSQLMDLTTPSASKHPSRLCPKKRYACHRSILAEHSQTRLRD